MVKFLEASNGPETDHALRIKLEHPEGVRSPEEGRSVYVQYGCGYCAPSDWVNFDASPTLRFERIPVIGKLSFKNQTRFPENVKYGNVVSGLPLDDSICSGVFASHVLEHLTYAEFDKALQETFRILKPGGIFRLVVPNLEFYCREYVRSYDNGVHFSNFEFLTQTRLGVRFRRRNLTSFLLDWLGNSRHLWMWDERSLSEKLREHGFVKIRKAAFNDCDDPHFRSVEDEERFRKACAIEARGSLIFLWVRQIVGEVDSRHALEKLILTEG